MPPSNWYKEFMRTAGVEVGRYKPSPTRYTGPPMDLANMRWNGVHSLAVRCLDCDHRATVNVDNQPRHLAVKSFERRMRCTKYGGRKIDVRPNWSERPTYVPR